ncbi:MAG: hypothetical protein ABI887_06800 [Burkholderiales bacterium]
MGAKRRGGQRRSKFDPQRIAAVERQKHALHWRGHGYTYQQIADAAGYRSKQAAHKAVSSALARTRHQPGKGLLIERLLDTERVDAMFAAIYPMACRGDLRAVAAVVDLMAYRARLLGLDTPQQSELFIASNKAPYSRC